MNLPFERVGPYVRALGAGLHALAPNQDWPPLAEILAHLRGLDPAVSGELLLPAEVHDHSGMPAFAWVERVSAEARVALESARIRTDEELARARQLDPALGDRLTWRRDLHAHLRVHPVLPMSRAVARARRLGSATEVLITIDGVRPDGAWRRVSLVLAATGASRDLGCATVAPNGRITLDPGLLHLVTRHEHSPLLALRAQIVEATEGMVRRVCRGVVGPFWFPGISLPDGVPAGVGAGLCVHASVEVVGDDVHHGTDQDPLHRRQALTVPAGYGVARGRRFACSASVTAALRDWCNALGIVPEINEIGVA